MQLQMQMQLQLLKSMPQHGLMFIQKPGGNLEHTPYHVMPCYQSGYQPGREILPVGAGGYSEICLGHVSFIILNRMSLCLVKSQYLTKLCLVQESPMIFRLAWCFGGSKKLWLVRDLEKIHPDHLRSKVMNHDILGRDFHPETCAQVTSNRIISQKISGVQMASNKTTKHLLKPRP